MEQARPLAEKAAQAFAATIKKDGGTIKAEYVAGRPVITTQPITRLQPGPPVSPERFFETGPPIPTEIPQFPYAGAALRDAIFGLEPGSVAVAPNEPRTVYYVVTLDRRLPAPFAVLYAPNGDYIRYQREAMTHAMQDRDNAGWATSANRRGSIPSGCPPMKPRPNRHRVRDVSWTGSAGRPACRGRFRADPLNCAGLRA